MLLLIDEINIKDNKYKMIYKNKLFKKTKWLSLPN